MDFEFSADQAALRDTVRRYLSDKAPLAWVRDRWGDPTGTTPAVWSGLAGLGVTGLLVPELHGGAGMGMVDMGVVLEEMGRLVHPGPFLSSAVGAVTLVSGAGTASQQVSLLPSLATGETVGTLAVLEPGGRGRWNRPATAAERVGDGWVLSGTKTPVFDGETATMLLVTAITADGLGVFVVESGAAGLDRAPLERVDGTRAAATVTMDRTPGQRLGQDGADAAPAVSMAVDRLLIGLVTDGVGAAGAALDLAVDYAKERVQFDRPIGSFQAVQHLCAEMLQSVELARAGAYYALWAADSAPPAERRRATAMAKAYASDALPHVGAGAIQVLGGIGFTWEHDAHLYYKRLLTLQEAWGGATDHLADLADQVI